MTAQTPLERWWARRTGQTGESAVSTFVVFLLLMPMIVGTFGIGFDVARNTYIRMSLQNDLDSAVVGAAAVTGTDPDTGKLFIAGDAVGAARTAYAYNRTNSPGLSCIGSGSIPIPGGAVAKCWVDASGPNIYNPCVSSLTEKCRIQWTVRERSANQFVKVLGIPVQNYELESEAVLEWQNY